MGPHEWVESKIAEVTAESARRNRSLGQWGGHFPHATHSPGEFYQELVRKLEARRVTGLNIEPVYYKEGGPFTPRRMYLKLQRERLVFEIGSFPFADGVFLSERVFDRRRVAGLLDFLIVLAVLSGLFMFLLLFAGRTWAFVATSGLFALLWSLMRLGTVDAVGSVDRWLSDLPVLGPIYELIFHPDTFHRQDTILAYRKVVHEEVLRVADEISTRTGHRPMTGEDRQLGRDPFLQNRW